MIIEVDNARGTLYSETSYAYYYDPTFGPFVLSSLRSSTFVFLFFSKHPHPLFSIGREGPYLLILFGFLSNSPHLKQNMLRELLFITFLLILFSLDPASSLDNEIFSTTGVPQLLDYLIAAHLTLWIFFLKTPPQPYPLSSHNPSFRSLCFQNPTTSTHARPDCMGGGMDRRNYLKCIQSET